MNDADPGSPERVFRWQALFQRTLDPLFILDRRRRLVFVNRAWEALAGLPALEAHGLICRRPRPATASESREEILAHVLTPPPEAANGLARVRRLLPGEGGSGHWWDVEFLPLRVGPDGPAFVLGRVTPVAGPEAESLSFPEKLVGLRERQVQRHGLGLLASRLPAMQRLADQVRLAARIAEPALLLGEPGTGKRTLARIIHYQGPRRDQALAVVDCVHLPCAALVEILFGELTRSAVGTVYVAEPASLPRDLQLRLSEWLVLAGREPRAPRLLAGCGTDPVQDVAAGKLLEPLRCALSMLVLDVPPLRQRGDDFDALATWLLARANEVGEPRITGLSPAAWELLRHHSWPGNLRELNDVLVSARRRAKGDRIDVSDLPASLRLTQRLESVPEPPADAKIELDGVLEQAERRLIEQALRKSRGNKTRAAERLGIWRPRLIRRMEALGIADAEDAGG